MTSPELFLLSVLRGMVEVAGFTMVGQGILFVLAGNKRHANGVYRLMQIITNPVVRAVRFITPRMILDKHIPLVAFFLLLWLWVGLGIAKMRLCASLGLICAG